MHADRLPPGQQLVARDKWPLVGEREPAPGHLPWTVSLTGQVKRECTWTVEELQSWPQVERLVDIHCVTRWSKPQVRFEGLLLEDLLERAEPLASARFVSFVALSPRQHSTSLALADALDLETLVVFRAEGVPLSKPHGGPARIVVPNRYFYKSLKWLTRIELLEDDRLGYWEAEAGYHNVADPWREQRYIAANLNRQQVARLIASRNLSGNTLLGISAAGLDLQGLVAREAILRHADFRDAQLCDACFDRANLSNARFARADLRRATFRDADLEGADFSGADLRGADLRGASLLGVSFLSDSPDMSQKPAQIDSETRIDPAALEQLTPTHADYLRRALPNSE